MVDDALIKMVIMLMLHATFGFIFLIFYFSLHLVNEAQKYKLTFNNDGFFL